jgi:hypothetical protein
MGIITVAVAIAAFLAVRTPANKKAELSRAKLAADRPAV